MTSDVRIRPATRSDHDAIVALLPLLASFDLPAGRNPEHLWHGDAALLERWFEGKEPASHVHVAVGDREELLGLTIITLQPELLSHEPSAHLEVIVVADQARGQGVGYALLEHTEAFAAGQGAESMSLHVFARNKKARGFYQRCGYDGELLRYIKPIAQRHEE